jgi:hypothetical protein
MQSLSVALTRWVSPAAICVSLAAASTTLAQAPGMGRPVSWHVKSAPHNALKPGAKFDVTVAGAIQPGWHVYALQEPDGGPIATQVGLAEGDPADVLKVTSDKPKLVMDPAFGMQTGLFLNTVDFTLHLQAAKEGSSGDTKPLHVLLRYQSCDNHVCLPPHTDTVEVPVMPAR